VTGISLSIFELGDHDSVLAGLRNVIGLKARTELP